MYPSLSVGFGVSDNSITSQIVLFGDHKQLGPQIISTYAEQMGLCEYFPFKLK